MTELKRLLRARTQAYEDLSVTWEPGKLTVDLPHERRHFVSYRVVAEHVTLRTTIATKRQLEQLADERHVTYASFRTRLCEDILLQNQHTESVCFRLNEQDRLEAVAMGRLATLRKDELLYYAATIARESDRFESFLMERDRW